MAFTETKYSVDIVNTDKDFGNLQWSVTRQGMPVDIDSDDSFNDANGLVAYYNRVSDWVADSIPYAITVTGTSTDGTITSTTTLEQKIGKQWYFKMRSIDDNSNTIVLIFDQFKHADISDWYSKFSSDITRMYYYTGRSVADATRRIVYLKFSDNSVKYFNNYYFNGLAKTANTLHYQFTYLDTDVADGYVVQNISADTFGALTGAQIYLYFKIKVKGADKVVQGQEFYIPEYVMTDSAQLLNAKRPLFVDSANIDRFTVEKW